MPQPRGIPADLTGDPLPGQTPQAYLPIINSAAPATATPVPSATSPATPTRSPSETPNATATATPIATPQGGVSRAEAISLFNSLLLPQRDVPAGFTGDVENCVAGTISAARIQAMVDQINFYRRMAGVPETAALDTMNFYAQAAAALMGANEQLDHYPPQDWKCYSADGATGAARSNLSMGELHDWDWVNDDVLLGPRTTAVEEMVEDAGPENVGVGHRHWLLGPVQAHVGIGEVRYFKPWSWEGREWIFEYFVGTVNTMNPDDDRYLDPWPPIRDGFVAWPPRGYVPFDVVYPRWSLHFPPQYENGFGVEVHLDQATVQMWMNGDEVPVTLIHKGDAWQTLVWEPAIDLANLDRGKEHYVQVRVRGIVTAVTEWQSIDYEVLAFKP